MKTKGLLAEVRGGLTKQITYTKYEVDAVARAFGIGQIVKERKSGEPRLVYTSFGLQYGAMLSRKGKRIER